MLENIILAGHRTLGNQHMFNDTLIPQHSISGRTFAISVSLDKEALQLLVTCPGYQGHPGSQPSLVCIPEAKTVLQYCYCVLFSTSLVHAFPLELWYNDGAQITERFD